MLNVRDSSQAGAFIVPDSRQLSDFLTHPTGQAVKNAAAKFQFIVKYASESITCKIVAGKFA
ncbi:MAG TPA: hypothetical protein PKC69_08660 [Chitinophagaceae bacterium]|mgnify:CR=1 FL=1|nr:hypothetical protein [Chitinophagaceae bacterium]